MPLHSHAILPSAERPDSTGVERFSTRLVPHRDRQQAWSDVVARAFPGMTVAAPEGISADLARCSLGEVGLARARSDRARVSRVASPDGDRQLLLHVLNRGSLTLMDGDRSSSGRVGDIIVADTMRPYAIDISAANDCMILVVPIARLGEGAADRDWHGTVLPADGPNVGFLAHMLRGMWSPRTHPGGQADDGNAGELDEDIGGLLAEAARLACSRRVDPLPAVRASHSPIEFALKHLADADLGTASIGDALDLSPRAVQKYFLRHVGATPTAFITARRLERAVSLMTPDDGQTITDIAFEVGFNDSAFFTRCFRRRYGVAPSRWRQQMRGDA